MINSNLTENDQEAMFYYGASLINDYQIDEGVRILRKFLTLYPDQKEFIKSNIKNEYAKKMIFENFK